MTTKSHYMFYNVAYYYFAGLFNCKYFAIQFKKEIK